MGQELIKHYLKDNTGELFITTYEYRENSFLVNLENETHRVILIFKEHPYYILSSLQNFYPYTDYTNIEIQRTNFYIIRRSKLISCFVSNIEEEAQTFNKIHFLIYTADICLDVITDNMPDTIITPL